MFMIHVFRFYSTFLTLNHRFIWLIELNKKDLKFCIVIVSFNNQVDLYIQHQNKQFFVMRIGIENSNH